MKNLDNGDYLGSEDPAFFSHLGSLGIRGIELERNRIQAEREALDVGTRTIAFENYRTFIAAAECGKHVASNLDQVIVRTKCQAQLTLSVKVFQCQMSIIALYIVACVKSSEVYPLI